METPQDDEVYPKYIVYLRPQGPLLDLLLDYMEKSLEIEKNPSHNYLPHCTITGFFTIEQTAPTAQHKTKLSHIIDILKQCVDESWKNQKLKHAKLIERLQHMPTSHKPPKFNPVTLQEVSVKEEWIGLPVKSIEWLVESMEVFKKKVAEEVDGSILIRPKHWTHISMTYDIQPTSFEAFQKLLHTLDFEKRMKDILEKGDVAWHVALYSKEHSQQSASEWMDKPLWNYDLV